ncbi:MAG: zinc ribbon domain-containing protein [Ignavibacteria bacterium]|nr:zinc ribbon domain-containing protein [Ignavibacteria bacterium]
MEVLDKIKCPQCGAENDLPVDEKFLECAYCGSAIYIDKKKVVTHFVIACNFNKQTAEGNLKRWMAGNFQVKDLDKLAQISQVNFYYFPMWYFKTKDASSEKIYLQPATSTSISEIKKINIPAGSLKVFKEKDYNISEFIVPDVMYDSAQSWLAQSGVNPDSVAESDLVHIPFYQFYYNFKGQQYTALVEASSGMVYANVWPAKSEAPFRIMFGAGIAVFLIMSVISFIIGFMFERNTELALVSGEMIKVPLYLVAAIPLIIIAYFIAKKV